MANAEQLALLKAGVEGWNKWRQENPGVDIDLDEADLRGAYLSKADLSGAYLSGADLAEANLTNADLRKANLSSANLRFADLSLANLRLADLRKSIFQGTRIGGTIIVYVDLHEVVGLETVNHFSPSDISTSTLARSKGNIPEVFLRGCGLPDWEIEFVKLYNPDLAKDEFIKIQNKVFDLRNQHAPQISPLFISYSHADGAFVDKIEAHLNEKGIRFWRDIHDAKAGRLEKQIDRAINQNPTVLLVLSKHSLSSDWVEHEVRTARALEKDIERDALCPIALDDSWKSSRWPKRIMDQIMEYNILDFSEWQDDSKFDDMFRKVIDGLELFYKG